MLDLPALNAHPLAVRAGEADPRLIVIQLVQRAEDLDLLAAHDVGNAARVPAGEARRDPRRAALPFDAQHRRCNLRKSRWTLRVRCFAPALTAADHAAHHNGPLARVDPI